MNFPLPDSFKSKSILPLFSATWLLFFTASADAAFSLPSSNSIPWGYDRVGAQGGIVNRTTVYQTIPAGASTSTIQNALDSCPAGQVVQLSAGNYNITARLRIQRSNITLRGAGPSTILHDAQSGGELIFIGQAGDLVNGASVTSGATKNSTSITLSSASGLAVGQAIIVDMNDNRNLVWLSGGAFGRHIAQFTRITSISGNNVGIWPPLVWDYSSTAGSGGSPAIRTVTAGLQTVGSGIEDLAIAFDGGGSATASISMVQCVNSWVKGVRSIRPPNRHFVVTQSLNCTFSQNWFDDIGQHAANTAGLDFYEYCSGMLVEDNIFYKCNIVLDAGGKNSGNVFAYNFILDPYQQNFGQYNGLWMNHGPHNMMNLAEGNFCNGVISDGYFGSSSSCTVFRNFLHGWTPTYPTANSIAVSLKKWSLNWNIVGNVLGRTGVKYFQPTASGWGGDGAIYELGFPNTGNNGYSGTRPPNPAVNPGDDQSRDLNVETTVFRHANFDFYNNTVSYNSGSDTALPASMYLTAKPAWMGNLPWPLIGPDVSTTDCSTNSSLTAITNPARERFYGRTSYLGTPTSPPVGPSNLQASP